VRTIRMGRRRRTLSTTLAARGRLKDVSVKPVCQAERCLFGEATPRFDYDKGRLADNYVACASPLAPPRPSILYTTIMTGRLRM